MSRNRIWFLGSVTLASVAFAAYLQGIALPRERFGAESRWGAVLAATADDREMAIEAWVTGGLNDARTIAGIGLVVDRLQGGHRCDDACLLGLLQNYSKGHQGNPVWIFDSSPASVMSVGPSALAEPVHEAIAGAAPEVGVEIIQVAGKPWVLFRIPVRRSERVIGWIALVRDPTAFVFSFLRLEALASHTAEAVLFERRAAAGVNVSPLRKPPYLPLALTLSAPPDAGPPFGDASGQSFRSAIDYGNAAVFDVTRAIAATSWLLQVKVDREEVYEDVWPGVRSQIAVFVALLSAFSALGISFVRSQQAAQQRELRLSNERLLQSQKVEAIGRLAGGIAHDFNNILSVILGHADQALRGLDDADPRRRNLLEIRDGSERAALLTRQLLAFSRRQVLQPRVLDLGSVVLGMEQLLRPLIGEDVTLELALAADAGNVLADPGQLEQVILNLVVNACDAMPSGGRLSLTTAHQKVPDPAAPVRYEILPPGNYVRFSVSDDGVGMTGEVRARVFEPFFTTKEVGQGSGLGLSSVYGIVKQSGGFVFVESALGQGASFHVFLPRIEPSDLPLGPFEPDAASRGGECVLLVEDNDALRELTRETLELLGYRVLEAPDGPSAIEVAQAHSGSIELLLSDVVMPKMSGPVLAERIADLYLGIKVLFISGYTADAIGVHGILEAGRAFLAKPFTADALAAKIREVLEKRV